MYSNKSNTLTLSTELTIVHESPCLTFVGEFELHLQNPFTHEQSPLSESSKHLYPFLKLMLDAIKQIINILFDCKFYKFY